MLLKQVEVCAESTTVRTLWLARQATANVHHVQPADINILVGQRVRNLRTARGWSQIQMAERLSARLGKSFDPTMVSRLENGTRPILLTEAVALTELLDRTGVGATSDLTSDSRVSAVAKRWLDDVEGGDLALGTKGQYHYAVKSYILPSLGDLRLREVTVPRVDAALKAVRAANGPGAAKSARSALSGVLGLAVRAGAMSSNPVRDTTSIPRKSKKEIRALTVAETELLTDQLRSDPRALALDLPDLIDFMLGTGMRIGEVCAIRGLVLVDKTVEVNATVIRVKGEGLVIQERPKTAAGHRVLALAPYIVELLDRRRTELRLRGPGGVVFASPRGRLRDPNNTSGDVREVLDALGRDEDEVEGPWAWVTSHVFRKTVATRLDEAGLSAREIADILGHEQPSMTQNVYMGRKVVSATMASVLDR